MQGASVACNNLLLGRFGTIAAHELGPVAVTLDEVTRSAARLSKNLLRKLVELSDSGATVAEVLRGVGETAERLGEPRPSYERVRVLVREARTVRKRAATGQVLLDVMLRAEPVEALVDHLAGTYRRYK